MSSRVGNTTTLLCKDADKTDNNRCPECGMLLYEHNGKKNCILCHYPDVDVTGRGQYRGVIFELPK